MDSLRLNQSDNALTLTIEGELTLDDSVELKKRFDEVLLETTHAAIVLDLSEVSFIDSSGIGALVVFNTKVKQVDRQLFLYRPSDPVRKTLNLVQLVSFFDILENEEDFLTLIPE